MKPDDINGCVLIPTYNNDSTLGKVLENVFQYTARRHVIVVNDGSTDQTSEILKAYEKEITLINHSSNLGKGYALRDGFREAIRQGYDYALTIDSDGQHFPSDIPKLIEAARQNPGAVIMGSRNMQQEDVPGKSSFGNKFSNFWFRVETGIRLPDTQTGFRIYPLQPLKKMRLYTTGFETEIEIIVRLAWKDIPFVPVKIRVKYDKEERVSHFRPFKDFGRISVLNTVLVTLTLLYYLPRRLIKRVYRDGLSQLLKEELIKPEESNLKKSVSLAFGCFMGIVPIWGFQLMVGIPLAILFRMNKVIFIAAAHISIPPMIPVIIFLSYYIGGYFVENSIELNSFEDITLETVHLNIIQYTIGAVVLAVVTGLISFLLSFLLFSVFRKKKKAGSAN